MARTPESSDRPPSTSTVDDSAAATTIEPAPQRPRGTLLQSRRHVIRMIPILGVIAIWWLLTATIIPGSRLYPPPSDVVAALVRILSGEGPLGSTYGHAGITLFRLTTAFIIAFIGGTLLGILAGRRKVAFDFMDNLVWIAMAVPSVVWVFILVIILGPVNAVPIAALVILLGSPVLIAIAEGTKAVPADLVIMARSYKATRWQMLSELYVPHLVPYMASTARVTFSLGIKIVIIAEVIGLPTGIGLLVRYWFDSLFLAPLVAWGILLALVGIAIDTLIFARLERKATTWAGSASTIEIETV